jgi:transcriptional regulator with XRE-family HTH domain
MEKGVTAVRVQALMDERGWDQSELARRVGCTPAAIGQIVGGKTQRSRYLDKIARVLGSTTPYLEGETDDRESHMPDEEQLTAEEYELIALFRVLDRGDSRTLLHLARSLSQKSSPSPAVHAKRQEYRIDR